METLKQNDNILEKLYMYKAHCYEIVDGDTIKVEIDLGFSTKQKRNVRLLNVDTPERNQQNFDIAKNFTKTCVEDKEIYIQTYKSDNFGRYLAKVYYTDKASVVRCLNDDLITAGLVKPNSKWNDKELLNYIKPPKTNWHWLEDIKK